MSQNRKGEPPGSSFLREWEKTVGLPCAGGGGYGILKVSSLDKDTHAFSSDATFASVVLPLTGSPPRCGASSSPHKVLRPCGGPHAQISADCVIEPCNTQVFLRLSSLSSSDFLSSKSPAEFLRSRNAVGGSAVKMAGWRLSMSRTMPYGISARKNRRCSCQVKVPNLNTHGGNTHE